MDTTWIAHVLTAYHVPAFFVGSFVLGETVILTASFLAAQGWWSLQLVFWVSLLGTLASDSMWFFLGRFLIKTKRWEKYRERYNHVAEYINRKTGNRPYLSLFFVKFVYGIRVLSIIYLSAHRTSFWFFLFIDTLASMILLTVVCGIGWLVGKGYGQAIDIFHDITYAISGVVLLLVLYKLIMLWIGKKAMDE